MRSYVVVRYKVRCGLEWCIAWCGVVRCGLEWCIAWCGVMCRVMFVERAVLRGVVCVVVCGVLSKGLL